MSESALFGTAAGRATGDEHGMSGAHPLSDDSAREEATDPRLSILLQAPAGSGKTTVLTQRLLRLLAEVDEPEEILAITFTRKAAAEMRARVMKALRGEIDTRGPQGARLRDLAGAALRHSALRGWNLADDPGRLRIQTIDSFNFRLASQLPVAAGAGGSLVVADATRDLYRHAARRALIDAEGDATLAADADLMFDRLDNNWGKVEELLERMLELRGHWLPHVLAHDAGALRTRVSDSLRHICRDHLARACAQIPAALRREAATLPDVGKLEAEAECLRDWQRLADLCLTQEKEWRKVIGGAKLFGAAYDSKAAKSALRSLIEGLSGVEGAREILREIASLPGPELEEGDAAALEALSRLLRSAAAHLQAEFSVTGRVDHTYVAGAARAALSDAGLPTDLALRTGLSLRHILVDEFQDTSLAQFDLVEALTAGWEEADGRTLFVVGDPMQSIYQFREAEVGLFLRARDGGIGAVRLKALQLRRNFRSVPKLIEWTNETFDRLFPAEDDLRASAVAFIPSVAARPASESTEAVQLGLFHDSAAAVQLRLFGEQAEEAAAVSERIIELRLLDAQCSVAVLVASRAHAVPIISALQDRGVACVGVDLVPLGEVAIVRDLVALLQALCHLGDRTAWLAVLRAPWCGLSLATLTRLSQRTDRALLWEAMADPERLAQCSAADQKRLQRLKEVLQGSLADSGRDSLPDWLERTWLRLGAAEAYQAQDLRHARAFFEALGDRVAAGEWRGTQDLELLLENLFAQPETAADRTPPVQIMTIHRAKGLEFDHVLLPALDRDRGRDREPLLRWLDLPRAAGESDLVMAPVAVIGEESGGRVGEYLKELMYQRTANEQVRLLYVAATRARQTLHLSAAPKPRADGSVAPRGGTLLKSLWPVLSTQFESATLAAEVVEAGAMSQPLRRLRPQWTPPRLEALQALPHLPIAQQSLEQDLEFSWVQETSRSIGTLVHAHLEGFGEATPSADSIEARRDEFAHQLRRHGVPEAELPGAVQVVIEALTRTAADERGRWIFSREHQQPQSELALTGLADGRLTNVIIDRSFVDSAGTRWVIDFKTSRHQGAGLQEFLDREMQRYEGQLRRYVELARGLGPHPVRAALYFPLLGAFRELT
ncbi:MAG TPA: UvrD-helicase domain-containing protein [Steroidobacteraceae bacterium]|nr:UvrD-helicase domain-containing protein [Steroidobacteraceae bacterium]